MSHLTRIRNVYTRKDLLIAALLRFTPIVEESADGRYWGGRTAKGDIVAKLGQYDLIFQLVAPSSDVSMVRDHSETAIEVPAVTSVYQPSFDTWNGEVQAVFGKNLCRLNAEYYSALLAEQSQGYPVISRHETDDEIVVTLYA